MTHRRRRLALQMSYRPFRGASVCVSGFPRAPWEADPGTVPTCDSIRPMNDPRTTIGKADAALDERLNDELDKVQRGGQP